LVRKLVPRVVKRRLRRYLIDRKKAKLFGELAPFVPDVENFLDVGSGLGRKTIPLTRYLNRDASYVGIDVSPEGIACA